MKLKETSTFTWSLSLPLIATGTVVGTLDRSFRNKSWLEIQILLSSNLQCIPLAVSLEWQNSRGNSPRNYGGFYRIWLWVYSQRKRTSWSMIWSTKGPGGEIGERDCRISGSAKNWHIRLMAAICRLWRQHLTSLLLASMPTFPSQSPSSSSFTVAPPSRLNCVPALLLQQHPQ